MFEVILSPDAGDFFAAAGRPFARKLAACFRRLEQDPPTGNNIKRLTGQWKSCFRYRVGDWRVIYRIDDAAGKVLVLAIAHRREVYE